MHEYSIARALLRQVAEQAKQRHARQVTRVRVRIGELSGVEPDLLDTAFSTCVKDDAICGAATLEIVAVPVAWVCPGCSRTFERGVRLQCPQCQLPARLDGGSEIMLDQIEMEVGDVH